MKGKFLVTEKELSTLSHILGEDILTAFHGEEFKPNKYIIVKKQEVDGKLYLDLDIDDMFLCTMGEAVIPKIMKVIRLKDKPVQLATHAVPLLKSLKDDYDKALIIMDNHSDRLTHTEKRTKVNMTAFKKWA